jgi:hypothetical protein
VKGATCLFEHPEIKQKLCEYFQQPRGCIKGKVCNFLHPDPLSGADVRFVQSQLPSYRQQVAHPMPMNNRAPWDLRPVGLEQGLGAPFSRGIPSGMPMLPAGMSMTHAGVIGSTARRPCQYWLLPRGCTKGEGCDFLHSRPCSFFNSDAGCIKGELCDFHHVKTADLDEQVLERIREHKDLIHSRPCPFFNSVGGCNKGDQCGFVHVKKAAGSDETAAERPKHLLLTTTAAQGASGGGRVCTLFNSPRGCIKGSKCDFEHPHMSSFHLVDKAPNPPAAGPSASGGGRVCTFFNTSRGCIKGSKCDFEHPHVTNLMPNTPAAAPSAAGASRACTFFNSPRGCIKGSKCDFEHVGAPGAHHAGMQGHFRPDFPANFQASAGPPNPYAQFNFNPATVQCPGTYMEFY